MNIRQEVETAITTWAKANNVAVAYEGKAFNKPKQGNWLEIVFLDPQVMNPTVDATRTRKRGIFQISCYIPDNQGIGPLEELTTAIVNLFPYYDQQRYQTFTVEQTPNVSSSFPEDAFRCAAVRVKYRQEF